MDEVLSSVDCVVTEGINQKLTHPYTLEEVKVALFQMLSLKL